ncbi:MAG TPA: hypothetical protein VGK10_12300 [Prolixibacteraceae bacterium]|jgi:hypothetical protein
MKKEKNNKIQLIDVIKDIKKIYEKNNSSIPLEEAEQVNKLFSEVEVIEKRNKKGFRFLIIIISLLFSLMVAYIYTLKMEIALYEKLNVTKDELIRTLDKVNEQLNLYLRGSSDTIKNHSTKNTYYLKTYDGKILTYYDLSNQVDSIDSLLFVETRNLELTNKKLDYTFESLKAKYGIDGNVFIRDITNGKATIGIQLISPKLDSALILYLNFRDKMYYNEVDSAWFLKK